MTSGPTGKDSASRLPLLAFVSDSDSQVQIKNYASGKQWPEGCVKAGDIETAITYLKSNPSPAVLLVEVASAESAPDALDRLADVCDPGVKVIVAGTINEYSFYVWLTDIGINGYLLKPFTAESIEAIYQKVTAQADPKSEKKQQGKLIVLIGSRGGVGTSTVAVNLSWLLANQYKKKTTLLDLDPQLGISCLSLDLEPSRGFRDALEKPDRIDSLFIDRVMVRVNENLSILSAEEAFQETIPMQEAAATALIREIREKYQFMIADMPRSFHPFNRIFLQQADMILMVTELNVACLRDALRLQDYCKEVLKVKQPVVIANRVGLAGKMGMPKEEFEKGLNAKISLSIPFALEILAASNNGEPLVDKDKASPASKAMQGLTRQIAGEKEAKGSSAPKGKLNWIEYFRRK